MQACITLRKETTMTNRPIVLSFFDFTGEAVRPWAKAGYECWCFDIQHPEERRHERVGDGEIVFAKADLSASSRDWWGILDSMRGLPVAMVFGFPPCTDLASSGALHWAAKRAADPYFQHKAVGMARMVAFVAETLGARYAIENPRGALSTLWRKADHAFDPCDFGGYLHKAIAEHPIWPEYIPAFDAYTKRTNLWTGGGFVMPAKLAVEPVILSYTKADGSVTRGSPQWGKLGGKSLKTKNIRSATPRGFAIAVFEANHTA
jgi:hypothetical protein